MERTVQIDGRDVRFRASAAIPRLYRMKFRRDIIQDMQIIQREVSRSEEARKAAVKAGGEAPGSGLPLEALTLFEDVAYLMALHADPKGVPDSADEWLDGFETFSIYTVFPVILELWGANMETLSHPKKKIAQTEREMSTALLMLRAAQIGVAVSDLDTLSIGMLLDMYTEAMNDEEDFDVTATQEDFDRF